MTPKNFRIGQIPQEEPGGQKDIYFHSTNEHKNLSTTYVVVQTKNYTCVHLHDLGEDNNHHFWIKKTPLLDLEKADLRKNDQEVGAAWDDWEGKWWGWSSSLKFLTVHTVPK